MSDALDRIAPEAGPKGEDLYRHSAEGSDDMPVSYTNCRFDNLVGLETN